MNKKLFYETPSSKVFEVRMEGIIASSDDNTENPIDDGDENL